MKHTSIIWFSVIPTPYNDTLFRTLSLKTNLLINVRYRAKVLSSHPWKTPLGSGYNCSYFSPILGIDLRSILMAFSRKIDLFVIAGWDNKTMVLLLTIIRITGRKYIIWTDTPRLRRNNRSILFNKLRDIWVKWLLKGSESSFSTGKIGVKRLIEMGAPVLKTMNLPFVLDLSQYSSWNQLRFKFSSINKLKIVSSGRLLNKLKGHDLAIRALSNALGFNDNWEYFIAGCGPDKDDLVSLAKELGVSRNVHFLGWVEPQDLIKILCESHLMIHASPQHDPYPNAILEGMAAGCVVFASDVCGSALDRISSGNNGYIHHHGDWTHLSDQIYQVQQLGNRMEKIANSARRTSENWSIDKSIEPFLQALNR